MSSCVTLSLCFYLYLNFCFFSSASLDFIKHCCRFEVQQLCCDPVGPQGLFRGWRICRCRKACVLKSVLQMLGEFNPHAVPKILSRVGNSHLLVLDLTSWRLHWHLAHLSALFAADESPLQHSANGSLLPLTRLLSPGLSRLAAVLSCSRFVFTRGGQ